MLFKNGDEWLSSSPDEDIVTQSQGFPCSAVQSRGYRVESSVRFNAYFFPQFNSVSLPSVICVPRSHPPD